MSYVGLACSMPEIVTNTFYSLSVEHCTFVWLRDSVANSSKQARYGVCEVIAP